MVTTPKKPRPAVIHPAIELVVRRGALRRFRMLKQKAANLPVNVVWDRRQKDRRTGPINTTPDRRTADRRHSPSFTWEAADFVIVTRDSLESIPLSKAITRTLKELTERIPTANTKD